MTRILITGGCGFIGHHLVNHILVNTDWEVVILDKLTYASNGFDRLRDINSFDDKRVHIFAADFTQEIKDGLLSEIGKIDYIVHMGAETHVDNSIGNAEPFVISNVVGTFRMLELARKLSPKKMLYFSTDEVFGDAPKGEAFREWDRYNSKNPYAATKAGGEELCLAYANTYKVPVFISHTMNVFGERQHWEKFIPMIIRKVLNDEVMTIHSDPTKTISGSRFYIHARNVASAVMFLLDKGETRDKYNVVGEKEVSNLDMARYIAETMGKELKYEMVDFHSSRPGHDLRYALNGDKMKRMGWNIPINFEDSLTKTVEWTLANKRWLNL
jgi:dTDP-glucose 4,6-dehydratase